MVVVGPVHFLRIFFLPAGARRERCDEVSVNPYVTHSSRDLHFFCEIYVSRGQRPEIIIQRTPTFTTHTHTGSRVDRAESARDRDGLSAHRGVWAGNCLLYNIKIWDRKKKSQTTHSSSCTTAVAAPILFFSCKCKARSATERVGWALITCCLLFLQKKGVGGRNHKKSNQLNTAEVSIFPPLVTQPSVGGPRRGELRHTRMTLSRGSIRSEQRRINTHTRISINKRISH